MNLDRIEVPTAFSKQRFRKKSLQSHANSVVDSVGVKSIISESNNTVMTTSQFMRAKPLPSRIKSRQVLSKFEKTMDTHKAFTDGQKLDSERGIMRS